MRGNVIMQELRKEFYHHQVFNYCLENIQKEDIRDTLSLKRKLYLASKLVGQTYEEDAIKRYNVYHKNPDLIDLSIDFLEHVSSFFIKDNELDISFYVDDFYREGKSSSIFKNTYSYLIKKISLYEDTFNRLNYSNCMYLINRDKPNRKNKKKHSHKINPTNAFTIINGVIQNIVKDVNDDEGWKRLNEEYRRRYAREIELIKDDNGPRIDSIQGMPIAFLSYAFDDVSYTYFLFKYFSDADINHHIFLYVDQLFNESHNTAYDIKKSLCPWIKVSKYFIFLRSINSDNNSLRPWCSWEIGNSFETSGKEYYKLEVIGSTPNISKIIEDFKIFKDVVGDRIEEYISPSNK